MTNQAYDTWRSDIWLEPDGTICLWTRDGSSLLLTRYAYTDGRWRYSVAGIYQSVDPRAWQPVAY